LRSALAGEDRLLLIQEGLEVVIRDLIDQVIDLMAVLNGRADGLMEGCGDINANPLVAEAGMKIEGWMLLPGPTRQIQRCSWRVAWCSSPTTARPRR